MRGKSNRQKQHAMEEKGNKLTVGAELEVERYKTETFDRWERWIITTKYNPQVSDIASAAADGWIAGYLFAQWEAQILEPKPAKEPTPAAAKQEIVEGSWVVYQDRPCQVVDVDTATSSVAIKVPHLLGTHLVTRCLDDVRPWTLQDARKGDYLAYDFGGDKWMIVITYGGKDVTHDFCSYDARKGLFNTDCFVYPVGFRPATEDEIDTMNREMEARGLHWNPDKLQLEVKDMSVVDKAEPVTDYHRLQQTIEEYGKRLDKIEERIKIYYKED